LGQLLTENREEEGPALITIMKQKTKIPAFAPKFLGFAPNP
jgi:hypothetical protein